MAWNGSDGAAKVPRKAGCGAAPRPVPSAKGKSPLRGVLAALVVVIGAGLAWWWLADDRGTPQVQQPSKPVPVRPRRANEAAKGAASGGGSAERIADPAPSVIPDAGAAAAAAEEARLKKWRDKFAKHRSIFTNASDQILGMIASTPPGRDMPPLPITKSVDHDFMKSLETPIEILDGDSAEVRAAKESVIKLRAEVLAIKESEGLSVYEILTQHQSLLRENAALRIEAQNEALDIYKSGDVELAREYVDKANEKLIELGSEPIRMPGTENPELRQHIREKLQTIKSKRNQQGRQ